MDSSRNRLRRSTPGVVALALLLVVYFIARLPSASAAERESIASKYRFQEMPIVMPPGYRPTQMVRQVNPAYYRIRSWISAVGGAVAMNDFTGSGRPDDICLVDPRTNDVVVTYAPTAPASDRFTPFVLNAAPLPMDNTMAPMGCLPGDFTGDGRIGLLVYYWGRTPILFLAKSTATGLSPSTYQPTELVPTASPDGKYHGPKWNTDAIDVADFAGTGHPDLFVGNYFPDSDVLNPQGQDNVVMNSSMSNAKNGGGDHVFRWISGTGGRHPSVTYVQQDEAISYDASTGWTLAASSTDLTGDGKPDLYIGNDFGKGHLLYNISTPDQIKFTEAVGHRGPTTPKSFVVGHGSFKGMGVDFADVNDNGKFDILVGNITTPWGLQESNLLFMNQAKNSAAMAKSLAKGDAPFSQDAEQKGVAWTGWAWDGKFGDFLNNGHDDIVQADGFVKGTIDRWNWLQEMAAANDDVYTNPAMWPNVQPGDDIAGHQMFAFYAPDSHGKYVNINQQLGMTEKTPSRAIATADTLNNGALDFTVARQWAAPNFYANTATDLGHYLDLNLYRPATSGTPGKNLQGPGTPAYGATVQIATPDGHTQISQLDGGGGHSGFRSFEVRFGLGSYNGPVSARIQWTDASGQLENQTLQLSPGNHTLCLLQSTAQQAQSCPVTPTVQETQNS